MPANRPEELHELFIAGINAKDLDALVELYEPDGVEIDLRGQALHGSEAVRKNLGDFLERTEEFTGGTRKAWVNGDLALLSSTWRGVVNTQDGQKMTIEGTSAEIARRQPDGTWRLVIDDPAFI